VVDGGPVISLRLYLVGALLTVCLLAVGGATAIYMGEVSARLEADLAGQGERATGSLATELAQTGAALDAELERVLDPRGPGARAHGSGGAAARYFWAAGRLDPGRLDLLKVLDGDDLILSSGHWPASLGATDPGVARYADLSEDRAVLVREPTPRGSAPSLQRWASGRWGSGPITAVVGRFLDRDALEGVRARLGVDLLALCGDAGPCLVTAREGSEVPEGSPRDAPSWSRQFSLHELEVGEGAPPPLLVVGLDRGPIERIQAGIRKRALGVGSASALLALLIGLLLSRGIIGPVEALATTSGRLAGGDLEARAGPTDSRISEVEELVEAFNGMAGDIQRSQVRLVQAERVAAWREIARGLAHELKNPLTPILGAMDVIRKARRLDRPDFDEILVEQATAVVDEVMRLKKLSDSFAEFARLPAPVPEPLDIAQLVDGAVALYAGGDEEVQIERCYAAALPAVVADRSQVQTVVTNLVKNAVEAMDHHGTLTLTLEPRGDRIELRVEDTGPGIPAEVRERLFTPYFTTKGSRGTGLGLAMTHRIVLEHGGSIEVGDAPGGGASFVIRLRVSGPDETG
jgi:two-component system, NtrC family, nitrogen regulation sensor histidine kinase NtrY